MLGLPCNMPAHSLQRAQYVNGLRELTPEVRKAVFETTAKFSGKIVENCKFERF